MKNPTLNRLLQLTFVPSLVLVAILTMYTRSNVVLQAVEKGDVAAMFAPAPATAEPASATPPAARAEHEKAAEKSAETAKPDITPGPSDTANGASNAAADNAASSANTNTDAVDTLTSEDVTILQQLKTRRAALDQRSDQLDQREALLQATEKRLDDKMSQLQTTRAQLQALTGQIDEQQQAQVASLVKIYETMKPQQAAAIFQQLDMPVLLQVLARMKEAKSSLVLAAMDPVKAKAVTTELMRKKDLPKVDPAPVAANVTPSKN